MGRPSTKRGDAQPALPQTLRALPAPRTPRRRRHERGRSRSQRGRGWILRALRRDQAHQGRLRHRRVVRPHVQGRGADHERAAPRQHRHRLRLRPGGRRVVPGARVRAGRRSAVLGEHAARAGPARAGQGGPVHRGQHPRRPRLRPRQEGHLRQADGHRPPRREPPQRDAVDPGRGQAHRLRRREGHRSPRAHPRRPCEGQVRLHGPRAAHGHAHRPPIRPVRGRPRDVRAARGWIARSRG